MNWREKLRALCPLKLDWAPMMPLEIGGARQTSRSHSQMRLHFRQFVAGRGGRKVNLRTIVELAFFLFWAYDLQFIAIGTRAIRLLVCQRQESPSASPNKCAQLM